MAAVPALSYASSKDAKKEEDKKPMNIIYIMSDDHSYQTISAYGDEFIQTPNLDRLANEGTLFTRGYVANSISGPSRACMLTGKHSHANGYITNTKASTFDNTQQTYPKLLQKAGYETAVIGKWHIPTVPTGFDHSEILIGQGHYYNSTFIVNGDTTETVGYATDITTDKAIEWMENTRDKSKPFCLLLHHKAPHRTWMPDVQDLGKFDDVTFRIPDNFYDDYVGRQAAAEQEMSIHKDMDLIYDLKMADKEGEITSPYGKGGRGLIDRLSAEDREKWDAYYDPIIAEFKEANLSGKELSEWKYQRYMRDYMSVITSLDRNIGRTLDYLEEEGLLENTMIVYTSDQGFYMGEHAWFDKRFMYEESFRTPLLVRLPGYNEGTVDKMVQNIDFGPTILDLAGIETPSDMHGVSFLPILKGEKVKDWRTSLYYHFYEYPAEHAVKRHYGVRTERYKLIHFYNDIDTWELYDLKKDPTEMNNIFGQAGTEKLAEELRQELIKLQELYDDPIRHEEGMNDFN
ncbi:MAG: sulfatase [Rikenellaceae bacterium]